MYENNTLEKILSLARGSSHQVLTCPVAILLSLQQELRHVEQSDSLIVSAPDTSDGGSVTSAPNNHLMPFSFL